jgi:alkanesulfonate monooxygenase SsuD/methylene tetrahydromethanopterin reductase-like flavin-dependent oxidoreductase (luciferase family)
MVISVCDGMDVLWVRERWLLWNWILVAAIPHATSRVSTFTGK